MEKIEVKDLIELDYQQRLQAALILCYGFWKQLQFFSDDRARVAKAICDCLSLSAFKVAVKNQRVVGVVAACDDKVSALSLQNIVSLKKHLGFFRGKLAAKILRDMFAKKLKVQQGSISLEMLAVDPDYKRQGIATQLVDHIASTSAQPLCAQFLDTNDVATSFFEHIGFARTQSKRTRMGFVQMYERSAKTQQ